MGVLARLLLLLCAVGVCMYGGYWTIKHDLHQFIAKVWEGMVAFVQTFDLAVIIRAVMLWVQKMTAHWLLVEVPKRIAYILLLPYVVLWLMPGHWRRVSRRWLRRSKARLLALHSRFVLWLRAEHMFGQHAGYAIGLLLAFVFFAFFYSVFWFYLALWLGLVKLPAALTAALLYLWGKFSFFLQKIPFAKVLFSWSNTGLAFLARKASWLRFWYRTEAERKLRARRRARAIIRRRYNHALLLRVGWREYRRLQRDGTQPQSPPNKSNVQ